MSNNPQQAAPESISLAIEEPYETSDGKKVAMLQFNRLIAEYPDDQIVREKIIVALSNFAAWLCIQRKSDGDYFAPRTHCRIQVKS